MNLVFWPGHCGGVFAERINATWHLSRRAPLALVLVLAAVQTVGGQERPYPTRPVTIVHPFAPGGIGFDLGHVIAERLEKHFGTSFVVEAKPGGNTIVGALSVVRAPPDGHSLLINATSIASLAGAIYKTPAYDPAADLTPVAVVARTPLILVVNPELPVHSLADLVQLAKSTPGGLSFGAAGIGGASHLSGEMLKRTLGVDLTNVPYRGTAPALTGVMGGHVPMMFSDALSALPLIRAGKVRPLGVTASERAEMFPDVPTFAELGFAGFDFDLLLVVFAPAMTPADIIANLNARIRAITSEPGLRTRFAQQGVQMVESPLPDELKLVIQREIARWSKRVQDAGLARSQ